MLKYISSFFWKISAASEAPLPLDEAYNVIKECEEKPASPEVEEDLVKDIGSYEVSYRVGKITEVSDGACRVDNLYDVKSHLDNLQSGRKFPTS
jgi:hypothetical protein